MSFIYGGNTGLTYDDAKRKRQVADALMKQVAGKTPRNVGEGLNAIGNALMYRKMDKEANAERENYLTGVANSDHPKAQIAQALMSGAGTGVLQGGETDFRFGSNDEYSGEIDRLEQKMLSTPDGPGRQKAITDFDNLMSEWGAWGEVSNPSLNQYNPAGKQPAPVDPRELIGGDGLEQLEGGDGDDDLKTINPAATANNNIQGAVLNNRRGLSRLQRVESLLAENPDLINDSNSFAGDVRRKGLEWRDYLAPDSMTQEGKDYLTNVSKFRLNVMQHVNLGIKEMTGAQMSETEAKRLMAAMPNQDDSPTVFKSKLDEAMYLMRMANARETYWAQKGIPGASWDNVPLTDMEGILQQRGSAIYQTLISQGVEGDAARQQAAQMLAQEFGL
ncbi:MAG: hypothetical protein ACPG4X_16880 [Pikeienuella sp.]